MKVVEIVDYCGFRIGFAELAFGSVVDCGLRIRNLKSEIRNSLDPINIPRITLYQSLEFHLKKL